MAIPFQVPAENEEQRLQQQLENVIMAYLQILEEHGLSSVADMQQSSALPRVAPSVIANAVQSINNSPKTCSPLNSLSPEITTNCGTYQQPWKQLGVELRQLADSFSAKHSLAMTGKVSISSVNYCDGKDQVDGNNNLFCKIMSVLLPQSKLWSWSSIFIFAARIFGKKIRL